MITDANVWIDLNACPQYLPLIFKLSSDIKTSDFVIEELEHGFRQSLTRLGLTPANLDEKLMATLETLRPHHMNLSVADLSVFILAKQGGASRNRR